MNTLVPQMNTLNNMEEDIYRYPSSENTDDFFDELAKAEVSELEGEQDEHNEPMSED